MTKWQKQNSRVYGQGQSYNLTNKITATELHQTLTQYENTIQNLQKQIQHEKQHQKLQQHIIALQMDLKVVQNDLDKIKEILQ